MFVLSCIIWNNVINLHNNIYHEETNKMLIKKEIDDVLAQKLVCYGILILLMAYVMKFIRSLANRTFTRPDGGGACCHSTSSHARVTSSNSRPASCSPPSEDKKPVPKCRRPRCRRRYYATERLVPREDDSYSTLDNIFNIYE